VDYVGEQCKLLQKRLHYFYFLPNKEFYKEPMILHVPHYAVRSTFLDSDYNCTSYKDTSRDNNSSNKIASVIPQLHMHKTTDILQRNET